ncbi:uncharacterized protein LODBEIA_P52100 [Lodderomyces beijingensis]|uniref:BSD domain-containing protein n=1 Tax=Lodderomyces beijingensis TaxID=1775926 RepID=A0ABP0ZV21_9ASCO
MDTVRGACSKDKVGGMVFIREDITPSMLEWKAVDDEKNKIAIPLNKLVALQATKESVPKMILQVVYQSATEGEPDQKIKLHFNNRPTMNNIKDALQTIVVRTKTRVEGSSTPTPGGGFQNGTPSASGSSAGSASASAAAAGQSGTPESATPSSSAPSSFGGFPLAQQALSDANLLKNYELQQKLLLEDRNLRNVFTKSVMKFKLSPTIFWSSRVNQLRTFALTVSQHKGPYNVLSTIKPVATSDNQVNVNVTRDTINEIFDIYPIIKRAFTDLVPQKLSEGEFWSRFFNSKLFRRLRGDKIGLNSGRGDVILDKYMYMDEKSATTKQKPDEKNNTENESVEKSPTKKLKKQKLEAVAPAEESPPERNLHVNKTIDLFGNEQDNSQKLGNRPDMTMRYDDDDDQYNNSNNNSNNNGKDLSALLNSAKQSSKRENEMIILMKNMNKLSSKMMSMSSAEAASAAKGENTVDGLSAEELNEYEEELNLHDLNDIEDSHYIRLNINTNVGDKNSKLEHQDGTEEEQAQLVSDAELARFAQEQFNDFDVAGTGTFSLTDTFTDKNEDIEKTSAEISNLIKQNFKTYKALNRDDPSVSTASYGGSSSSSNEPRNLVPSEISQEIITYNITIVEFLSHFWKLFLHGKNPQQLKKIFTSLKNCSNSLKEFKTRAVSQLESVEIIANNAKLKDKVLKDFNSCLEPLELSLSNAISKYVGAVHSSSSNGTTTTTTTTTSTAASS